MENQSEIKKNSLFLFLTHVAAQVIQAMFPQNFGKKKEDGPPFYFIPKPHLPGIKEKFPRAQPENVVWKDQINLLAIRKGFQEGSRLEKCEKIVERREGEIVFPQIFLKEAQKNKDKFCKKEMDKQQKMGYQDYVRGDHNGGGKNRTLQLSVIYSDDQGNVDQSKVDERIEKSLTRYLENDPCELQVFSAYFHSVLAIEDDNKEFRFYVLDSGTHQPREITEEKAREINHFMSDLQSQVGSKEVSEYIAQQIEEIKQVALEEDNKAKIVERLNERLNELRESFVWLRGVTEKESLTEKENQGLVSEVKERARKIAIDKQIEKIKGLIASEDLLSGERVTQGLREAEEALKFVGSIGAGFQDGIGLSKKMFDSFSDGTKNPKETFDELEESVQSKLEKKFGINLISTGYEALVVHPSLNDEGSYSANIEIVEMFAKFDPKFLKPIEPLKKALDVMDAIKEYKNHLKERFSRISGRKEEVLDSLVKQYRKGNWGEVQEGYWPELKEEGLRSRLNERLLLKALNENLYEKFSLTKEEEKIFKKYYIVCEAEDSFQEGEDLTHALADAGEVVMKNKDLFKGDNIFTRILNLILGITEGYRFFGKMKAIKAMEDNSPTIQVNESPKVGCVFA